ncbi:EF-P 5-aminopentanol modification-associated protein YfmH [Lapidilactobacillus luobeiensis]|uniref:EF-P 5-aminopentanol modification-associated protein YfmH n=1 Tax=Lapidilactobacillus luobeiensis TaxID=2950371 RepID=UPI0021C43669|nr:pitrilysin family protein [Lapidilactobacillus luobeiensis]
MTTLKLTNGLTIDLIDKPGYLGQFGLAMVDFGAIDRRFPLSAELTQELPAGTAHFLEHQLFNKASGDISERFAANQAETNAFTTPSKTAYYFSGAGHLTANLELLAELVAEPYFTATSVEKERRIIGQELDLYRDQPDWALVMGLMARLYPDQPIADDVGGSPATLAQITPELLLAAHHYFYQPQRMRVSVVADLAKVDLTTYFQTSSRWRALGRASEAVSRQQIAPIPAERITPTQIAGPTKIALGFRGTPVVSANDAMTLQVDLELILSTLFGETSQRWREWRDEGLVDDSFQFTTTVERALNYVLITTNTPEPERCLQMIQAAIMTESAPDPTVFALVRKEMIGNVMFSQDNLENLGIEAAELGFYHWDSANLLAYLQQVQLTTAWRRTKAFIATSQVADFRLLGDDEIL